MTKLPSGWVRDLLLAVGYAAVFLALSQTAHVFWYLPAGWRFVALLLTPYRCWGWFIALQMLSTPDVYVPFVAEHGVYGVAVLMTTPLTAAIGPWWLRHTQWSMQLGTFASMARLLGAMVLAIAGAMLGHLLYPFTESALISPLRLRLQLALRDYIGMLALVPLVLIMVYTRPGAPILRRWAFDVPCILIPVLLLYVALTNDSGEAQVFFFSALLCLVPSIYFAVRTGWRGAAFALTAASITVACSGAFSSHTGITVEAQGFLAVAGSASLLLGAVYDTLRSSQDELEERNASLLAASTKQDRLVGELRDAASRNLNLSEQVRRWITSELHDEIGQNLAALQTRVRLLEREARMEGSELATEISATLARMRHTVSGLMSTLRPAGLDDFGLAHALRDGAIRRLLETSGVAFELHIDDAAGHLSALDDNAQTTLYRIVQEAATNTVRHASARRFCIRVRARGVVDGCRVLLALNDDGGGFDTNTRSVGIGLQGIRDRVFSLGGRLRLRSGAFGTRMQVWLCFAAVSDNT